MLGVKFLQDIRDTGSTFAGFGCQRTGALFEGNEHERSDGIFWAMDDDLLSGWFRTGERFKTILKFLCGPFLDVMIDIYCVTVPYIFFYISVCIFYAMRSILKSIQMIPMFMWFFMLMCYDGPTALGWGILAIPMCQICTHEKSWKWSWIFFSLHIIVVDYIHWTLSFIFILHTYVVQILYHLLILWIQYTIWITNLNVYIRKLHMIHFSTAELLHRGSKKRFYGWASGED